MTCLPSLPDPDSDPVLLIKRSIFRATFWANLLAMATASIIIGGLLLWGSVHAETCKPPNVARTVYPLSWQLVCPVEGVCRRVSQHGTETHLDVLCLTPGENARAEARVP